MIDLHVSGSPSSVRAAGDWMIMQAKAAVAEAGTQLCIFQDTSNSWVGDSGDAYRELARRSLQATDEQFSVTEKFGYRLQAYAGQLSDMQQKFDFYRDLAVRGGLDVVAERIHRPAPGPVGPLPDSLPEETLTRLRAQQDRAAARMELYLQISADVGTAWGELEAWVNTNLNDAWDGTGPGMVMSMVDSLRGIGGNAADRLDISEAAAAEVSARLAAQANRCGEGARDIVRQLRSGNPAVRAAAEAANPEGLRALRRGFSEWSSRLGAAGEWLGRAGAFAGLYLAWDDIRNGDSPSGVAVQTGAGMLTGELAAAAIPGAGPILAVALGLAGGAVGGWSARDAYESVVPLESRENLDEWLGSRWDDLTDDPGEEWSRLVDATGGDSEGVVDAWDEAFT